VEAWGLYEEVAGELLFRVGIRSVEHIGLAVVLAHRRGGRTRLQPLAGRRSVSLGERLVEGAEVRPQLLLRSRGEGGFVVVNQHHESHLARSFSKSSAYNRMTCAPPAFRHPPEDWWSTAPCRMTLPSCVIGARRRKP